MSRGLTTPTTDPPTAAECNTEAEARAGMGTVARMTCVRAAAKNAFTEPPSTAPTPQLAARSDGGCAHTVILTAN